MLWSRKSPPVHERSRAVGIDLTASRARAVSVEAHQSFRESDRFAIWRGGIGPFFAQPPHVEHYADVED